MNGLLTIHGIKLIVSPDVPKMQLSERVKEVLSPEMIEETNAWMLRFFGTTNLLADGDTWQTAHGLHMNPRTFANLKAALEK